MMNYLQKKKQALLNYVQSGGGRLPSEYQEVDYILNDTMGAYIDTGVIPYNAHTEVYTKMAWVETTNDEACFLGARINYDRAFFINMYPQNKWEIGWSGQFSYKSGTSFNYNQDYELYGTYRSAVQQLWADNVLVVESNFGLINGCTVPLYIFKQNYSAYVSQCRAKVYYMQLKQENDLVRDFVPCYRKSDNEVGLYDLVTQTFFTNQGSGSFTYGTEV